MEPGSNELGPVVPGYGPMPSRWVAVSEKPGIEETRHYPPRPFVGRSGQELRRFFNGYRLPNLDRIYTTNVVKQIPFKKKASVAERAYWYPELVDEIRFCRPELIIALGADAAKIFLGPDVSVERVHGLAHAIPRETRKQFGLRKNAICVPTYHPAAMLHSPELQSVFAADMDALALGRQKGFQLHTPDTLPTRYLPLPIGVRIPREFSIDTEGWADDPFCLTISWEPGVAYIVYAHQLLALETIRIAVSRATRVTCQGMLADLDVLAAMGIHVPDHAIDDTQIMAFNCASEPLGLKDLAYRHLGAEQEEYADVIKEAEERNLKAYVEIVRKSHDSPKVVKACARIEAKLAASDNERSARELWRNSKFSRAVDPPPRTTLHDADPERVRNYACRDADLTERLRPLLRRQLGDRGLEDVYRLDLGVIPVVNRMQHVGMRISPEHFRWLSTTLLQDYITTYAELERAAGHEVNPNSGPQVARLVFGQLGFKGVRMTRSRDRYSTEDKYLEALRGKHPAIDLVIDGRELTKLKSAYADAILNHAIETDEGWFIFPHLRISRVVSGRVSAHDPNVLAIPKHSKRGKAIRQGFLAGEGRTLLSIDLSQIELRVAAHDCGDEGMRKIFIKGGDIHADLGYRLFGVKPELQDESIHRLPCKKGNFGFWMGISAGGLRDQIHAAAGQLQDAAVKAKLLAWKDDDCQKIINEMNRAWPKAVEYKQDKIAQARRVGYVTDFMGRRRYLAGVHSEDQRARGEAERQAHATPIQSGAQEIFKAWMAASWNHVHQDPQRAFYLEPWLQVHDDFLNEVDLHYAAAVEARIMACIPQTLSVPVEAKAKRALTWGAL